MINRKLRCALGVTALVTSGVLWSAGTSSADPPGILTPDAPPHRHFIQSPNGDQIMVGPNICEHPELQQAFNEFHYNIHHSFVPADPEVTTLGPQAGAPGLHNRRGAELVAKPGCPG